MGASVGIAEFWLMAGEGNAKPQTTKAMAKA